APVSGTFSGLPEGAVITLGGNQFRISYVGGDGNDLVLTAIATANKPPVANAGGPYTIPYGASLTLNASASTDADGDSLTYSWTINGHANAASGVSPTLTWSQLAALGVDTGQVETISVLVDDGHGFTASAQTTLTVNQDGTTTTLTSSANPS